MSSQALYELVGYAASLLIIVSLAMSSVVRLRIVNLAGTIVFTVYGALIGSLPVVATNVAIAGINVWFLRKAFLTREEFTVVPVGHDDPFLDAFVAHHEQEIATYRPVEELDRDDVRFVMLRDVTMVGVFVGRRRSASELEVLLDYVAPAYRDLKTGRCLYRDDGRRFADQGFAALVVEDVDPRQRDYFANMGFTSTDHDRMVLDVR